MQKLKRFSFSTILYFLFWLAYTSSLKIEELLVGLLLSMFISFFTFELFTSDRRDGNILKSIFYFLGYIPVFLWEMIKANIDVAKRVLSPSLPINPGIVSIKTDLSSENGKLFLANSITLTPGTLSLDIDGETLYIHWIDVKSNDRQEQRNLISGKFEKLLGGIF